MPATQEGAKRYNGWANYETWCVNLWLDNDEGLQDEKQRLVREHCDEDEDGSVTGCDTGSAADALKAWVEEMAPDLGGTLWADLLNSALAEVDWYEIANTEWQDMVG